MISLREATQSDDREIREMIHAAGINPMGLDWRRFVLAVTERGEIAGCGQVKPHRDGSLELASISVQPGWQRQGAARQIIEYLLKQNPGPLYLTCRSGLGPFYEKFGFRTIDLAEMPPYFRRITRLVQIFSPLHIMPDQLLVMRR